MALAAEHRWQEAEPLLTGYASALEAKVVTEGGLDEVIHVIIGLYDAWGKPDKAAEWRKKLGPVKKQTLPQQ